ncbi:MAG TPA: helix-turn-helix domain-containing protein [Pyrinomonadaceae bacterium]|nr:helix-turn-helix domain-containing protein [Pyrinomonadaceae bacterium]
MDLQTSIHDKRSDVTSAENIVPLCELAKGLEEAGEFESAVETLYPFWNGPGNQPLVSGLHDRAKAELLLRAGTLTGWIGSSKQISGAQEAAKDLISESATIFEALRIGEKVAEAHVDLAICYWREGAMDEARVTLQHVLERLGNAQSEQKLRALLNSAIVENVATRERESLRIYRQAYPLFEASSNHALKGKFHNSYATLLRSLGSSESRPDYIDKALVEYAAASYHFERAGHRRFQARVENNVGYLYATIGRFQDAQEHLTRARKLHLTVGDLGGAAGAEDSSAQAFLLEGKYDYAERAARSAVRSLMVGGEQALLAEALTTHGIALARLKRFDVAKTVLDQAVGIGQSAGSPERGGIAAVTAIEELSNYLLVDHLQQYYSIAESMLSNSQNRSIRTRLGECARRVLAAEFASVKGEGRDAAEANAAAGAAVATFGSVPASMPPGFSLDAEVLRYEGSLIRKALEDSGGSVTRAARLLGVTHQGLAFILNGRHSDLLSIRTPVKKRRRSVMRNH